MVIFGCVGSEVGVREGGNVVVREGLEGVVKGGSSGIRETGVNKSQGGEGRTAEEEERKHGRHSLHCYEKVGGKRKQIQNIL